MRCLGSLRFTLYGVWRYIILRRYIGALYYLNPDINADSIPSLKESLDSNLFIRENGILY
jgi:hypothetical protein